MKTIPLALLMAALSLPACLAALQVPEPAPAGDPAKEKTQAIDRARAVLADKLKVLPADLTVESATPATWGNSSLGCPAPDHMYAQVVTHGFAVVLSAKGQKHEVHVARSRAVICKEVIGRADPQKTPGA